MLANMGITNNVKLSYSYNKTDQYIVYNSQFTSKPKAITSLDSIEIIDSISIKNNLDKFLGTNDIELIISKEKNVDVSYEFLLRFILFELVIIPLGDIIAV